MKKYTFIILGIAACLVMAACTNVMSTSWGSWAKRNQGDLMPTPNAGNVGDLVDMVRGDPDAAKALLGKLKDAVKGASGSDKAALQGAGISAAAEASGLGTAVIENAGKLLESAQNNADEEQIMDTLEDIFNSLKGNDLSGTANDLVELLANGGDTAAIGEKTTTDDALVAAMALLVADAQETAPGGDFKDYLDTFQGKDADDPGLTPKQQAALELAKIISGKEGTGGLLDGLGLNK